MDVGQELTPPTLRHFAKTRKIGHPGFWFFLKKAVVYAWLFQVFVTMIVGTLRTDRFTDWQKFPIVYSWRVSWKLL